jgi:transposase-like protein
MSVLNVVFFKASVKRLLHAFSGNKKSRTEGYQKHKKRENDEIFSKI